jgi:hypothetical protein
MFNHLWTNLAEHRENKELTSKRRDSINTEPWLVLWGSPSENNSGRSMAHFMRAYKLPLLLVLLPNT